jgi:UDP-glucuronate 4-epimerase
MAMFRLIASSLLNKKFLLSASPELVRDFTFVDDVSRVISSLINNELPKYKFEIFNVAGGHPYSLNQLFEVIEANNISLRIERVPPDSLDVKLTHGSTKKLSEYGLPIPSTSLSIGVRETIDWFQSLDIGDIRQWFEYSENV